MTHEEIKRKYITCTACGNCKNTRKVFGCGNLKAKIAIVGEGPWKEEEAELIPFVGPAGKLLNQILLGINLKREDLFITNAVICRTDDKNRTPTNEEIINCRQRLIDELTLVNPQYTILTGSTAIRTIFGENHKLKDVHGTWKTPKYIPCHFYYLMYHPSWILHHATEEEEKHKKSIFWEDTKKFARDMQSLDIWKNKKEGHLAYEN